METQKIDVCLSGLADIMFDRFKDHSEDVVPPEQKLYLDEKNRVVIPSEFLYAFLFNQNTRGCALRFERKKGKEYAAVGQSHIFIKPDIIPISDEKGEIVFKDFKDKRFWISEFSPVCKKGVVLIKMPPNKRPVLKLPWKVSFEINLIKNDFIDENKLYNWFMSGGILIGLGNYRPRFGRFEVKKWDVK